MGKYPFHGNSPEAAAKRIRQKIQKGLTAEKL